MIEHLDTREIARDHDTVVDASAIPQYQALDRDFTIDRQQIGAPELVRVQDGDDDVHRPFRLSLELIYESDIREELAKIGLWPAHRVSIPQLAAVPPPSFRMGEVNYRNGQQQFRIGF